MAGREKSMQRWRHILFVAGFALAGCPESSGGGDPDGPLAIPDRAVVDGRTGAEAGLDLAADKQAPGDQGAAMEASAADQAAPGDSSPADKTAPPDLFTQVDAGCGSGGTWALSAGGSSLDYVQGLAVAGTGESTITGYFTGTTTFGSHKLTSAGGSDIFVARISRAGKVLWAVSAGGASGDVGGGVAVDAQGNSYIAGSFSGTAKFGAVTLKTLGTNDIFVAKLDSTGKFLWALFAKGTTKDMTPSIAVDSAGQAHITGFVTGKVAASGASFLWTEYTDGVPTAIDLDSAGNLFVAGYFKGTAKFGAATFTAASAGDVFVARLDAKGKVTRATRGLGLAGGFAAPHAVDVDPAGRLALAGGYRGTHSFGASKLTSSGSGQMDDAFAARMDAAGKWLWAASAGGSGQDAANGVVLDPAGGVDLAGAFAGSATFGSVTLQALGSSAKSDIFWARIGPKGAFLSAARAGGADQDMALGLGRDSAGYSLLSGVFKGNAMFAKTALTPKGNLDIFMARLDRCAKP